MGRSSGGLGTIWKWAWGITCAALTPVCHVKGVLNVLGILSCIIDIGRTVILDNIPMSICVRGITEDGLHGGPRDNGQPLTKLCRPVSSIISTIILPRVHKSNENNNNR